MQLLTISRILQTVSDVSPVFINRTNTLEVKLPLTDRKTRKHFGRSDKI